MRSLLLVLAVMAASASWTPAKADDCARGYRVSGDVCVLQALQRVSPDAGVGECNPGFQEIGGRCWPNEIPRNARLTSVGDGWVCNRGFRQVKSTCVIIIVPRNATLGGLGREGWVCNRGFYEVRGVCLAEDKPQRTATAQSAYLPAASVIMANRRADNGEDNRNRIANGLAVLVAIAITGVGIFLMREPPMRNAPNLTMSFIPRPRGSAREGGAVAIWRPFGHRIDALTGAAIPPSAPVMQCRNCRACYQAESVAALRRENAARCVACGRAALSQNVA